MPACDPSPRSWLPKVVAGLLGWNIVVTVAWLNAQGAHATEESCPGLRREVADLRRALEHKDGALRTLSAKLRAMAQGNIRTIENALDGTGLKVDTLIKRGQGTEGQGGPFIPESGLREPNLHGDVQRWDRLRRALQVLPLAAPLKDYEVTSKFGKRRDPINRRRAMHAGIDLKAPVRSPVLSTAPGRVVYAGRKGGYGRMVEIDHGLGVHTRYGHLAVIHVREGQQVGPGSRIGLLGSTGRSTGPHLHYEVVVDGRARNPQPFLKAGVKLRGGE